MEKGQPPLGLVSWLGTARWRGTWIQRSFRFSACGQMVSLQPAFMASSATASTNCVLFLTLQTSPGGVAQDRTGPGGHQGRKDARVPQTHWHTYTSRGGRVLGVMIQGATRNTTMSVKIGDSEKSCRGRAERTEPGPSVQRLG